MKSRLEILAEVLKPEEKGLSILKRHFTSDCVSPKNCIKAMKIAMKQAFETGYYFGNRYGYTDEELTFDE